MKKIKSNKIAGILYILAILCPVIIFNFNMTEFFFMASYAILAISLLSKNKKAMTAGFAMMAVVYGIYASFGFRFGISTKYDADSVTTFLPIFIYSVLDLAACVTAIVFTVLSDIGKKTAKIWFIPFLLLAAGEITYYVAKYAVIKPQIDYMYGVVIDIAGVVAAAVGLFFAMLWTRTEN